MTIDVLQCNPANWIQASDPNTLYDAETGGNLVAAGGAVARLEDKSGNGRHWTQATASYRPTRQVAVQNGKDVIRLDGVNDTMGRAGFMTGATAGTFLFVLKLVADPPVTVGLGAPFSAWGGYGGTEHMPWVDGDIYYNWGGNTRFNSGNPTQSMAAWRIFSITSAANSWILRIDGVTFYTSSSNTVTWGAEPKIGGAYGTYYPACDIAEAIAVPSLLSEAQRQKAEGYLAWEWGIQGNLDASHPYKNAAPTDTASVGEGTITLGTLTQAAAGVLELKASSAITLGAMTASSAGKIAISGDSAKALGVLTQTAQGTLLNNGQAAQTLGDLTQAAQGTLLNNGQAAQTLGDLTQAAQGTLLNNGQAAQTLGVLTQTAQGILTTSVAHTLDAESGAFVLTGVVASIVQGYALNAEAGSFTLIWQEATFTQSHVLDCEAGSFTVIGNDAEFVYSGGEAEPTFSGEVVLQRKRVYIKRGKQYLIFNTLAEADSYVAAEEAIETARQSSRGAARRKVKALNVPKPEVVPAVEPDKLEVMLERFNLPFNLSAAISKEDFAALHYIQEQLAIMQDDEDIELLLLTL